MAEYEKTVWEDSPSTATPLNADNLNKLETGLQAAVTDLDPRVEGVEGSIDVLSQRQFQTQPDVFSAAPPVPPRGTQWVADGEGGLVAVAVDVLYDSTARAAWVAGSGGRHPVRIITETLQNGTKNSAYAGEVLVAQDGSTPYTWSVAPGSPALQTGLTLTASAVTTTGVAVDVSTNVFTKTSHGYLDRQPLLLTDADTATAITEGTIYYARDITSNTFKIAATAGGTAIDITGSNSSALKFKTVAGAIFGTPTANADRNIVFRCTDAANWYVDKTIRLFVADVGASLGIDLPATMTWDIGSTLDVNLAPYVTNGTGPFTYTSYNTTTITGVTGNRGADTFDKTAHGLANGTAIAFTGITNVTGVTNDTRYFVVNATANSFQVAATLGGVFRPLAGSADDSSIVVRFPTLPNKNAILDGSTGHITSTGVTGSSGQSFGVSIVVTDSLGATANDSMTVTLAGTPPVTVTTTSLAGGTKNTGYVGETLYASGGVAPYSWAVKSGSAALPAGLTLVATDVTTTGISADVSTNVFTKTSHGYKDRQPLILVDASTVTGITVICFVRDVTTNTFKIAATPGGTAIDIGGSNSSAVKLKSIGGTIFGTPTAAGTVTTKFTVTDSSATPQTDDSPSLSIAIADVGDPLAFNFPTTFSWQVGSALDLDLNALYTTGGTGSYTYTMTAGSGHNVSIVSGHLKSGSGGVTGAAGATFTVTIRCDEVGGSAGTITKSATVTLTGATAWATSVNIADYGGGVILGETTEALAVQNRNRINAAIVYAAGRPQPARIYFDNGSATEASKALCYVSGQIKNVAPLNSIDLPNIWLKMTPQAHQREGSVTSMFYMKGVPKPLVNICLDGNGANQDDTDMTRVPTYSAPYVSRWGSYFDGVAIWESGSSDGKPTGTINGVKGKMVVINMRGVTGSSHNTFLESLSTNKLARFTDGVITGGNQLKRTSGKAWGTYKPDGTPTGTYAQAGTLITNRVDGPGIPSDTLIQAISSDKKTITLSKTCTNGTGLSIGIGVDNIEVFDGVVHGCFGGDDFEFIHQGLDGDYPKKGPGGEWDQYTTPRASGLKFHYTQLNGNDGIPAWSKVKITTYKRRHGGGGYCGGRIWFLPGSTSEGCNHNFNVEAGIAADSQYHTGKGGPGCHSTLAVRVGDPAGPAYGQVVSRDGTLGFQINGNSGDPDDTTPDGEFYGFESHSDARAYELDNRGNAFTKIYGGKIDSPDTYAIQASASYRANIYVADLAGQPALIKLGPGVKTNGGWSLQHGDFTTYAGGD